MIIEPLRKLVLVGGGLLVALPGVALLVVSFRTSWPLQVPQDVWLALWRSVILAIVVALISSVIGFLIASSYVFRKPSKTEWLLIALALITPELPIAVSLQPLFAVFQWGIPDMVAVSLGQLGFPTALTVLFVYLRLDSSRADALVGVARTLGAKSASLLVLLLRLSWPAVFVGFLNAAAFSLQDVAYPWFLGSASFTVLPTLVFSRARFGLQPWMIWYGALAAFCGALVAIIAFLPEVQLEEES